jgi:hypothetical protein
LKPIVGEVRAFRVERAGGVADEMPVHDEGRPFTGQAARWLLFFPTR